MIENKIKAQTMRKNGFSLGQITSRLKVPRSTVYYWISKIPLSVNEEVKLRKKRENARIKGGLTRHKQRLETIKMYEETAIQDIKKISPRELFLIGISLYWAEGSKQKNRCISQPVIFSNNDPKMIRIYCRWLDKIAIPHNRRKYTLYIHRQYLHLEPSIKNAWQGKLFPIQIKWEKTIYKHHNTKRPIDPNYLGLLKITLSRSTDLNRKIAGWITAVSKLTTNKL